MNGLIYVDDEFPGITRKRVGKGWAYYDPEGKLIKDRAEKRRLNAIALPPAYTDSWYCPAPNGHILATGLDAKGRKQYRYHPEFRAARESEKFDRCLAFGNLLPLVRKRVEEDLSGGREISRDQAVASVVRLLDLGAIRVGNEGYAERNNSFGATTLRQRHAEVTGRKLRLRYKGKAGKMQDVRLTDASLARAVRKMQDLPGQRVFQYVDDGGEVRAVGSSDVNEYLEAAMGERFTAKNFRTWHATVLGFDYLRQAQENVPMKALLESVAAHLGNTPAVTRKSYIHPAVLALIEEQEGWRDQLKLPRPTRWHTREERAVIELLQGCPGSRDLLQIA
ncbi:DNA topoisomerase IB [Qipengyuania sp.]|uniref:DNA topoisomerase IB n=1 Tax=Qipengyuania sp. TaxID=2004515 RepID=UPI0037359824